MRPRDHDCSRCPPVTVARVAVASLPSALSKSSVRAILSDMRRNTGYGACFAFAQVRGSGFETTRNALTWGNATPVL
jgi:hypothetical protein